MGFRTTLEMLASKMHIFQATMRKADSKHMWMTADFDGYYQQTLKGVPVVQPLGVRSHPLKQKQQQGAGGMTGGGGSFGGGGASGGQDQQPTGKCAEALIFCCDGNPSNAYAMLADRRVEPYDFEEGDSSFYHAGGNGSMTVHKKKGTYHVVSNMKDESEDSGGSTGGGSGGGSGETKRSLFIRFAKKERQQREQLEQGDQSSSGGQQQSGSGQPFNHQGNLYHQTEYHEKGIKHHTGDPKDGRTDEEGKVIMEYKKDDKKWEVPKEEVKTVSVNTQELIESNSDKDISNTAKEKHTVVAGKSATITSQNADVTLRGKTNVAFYGGQIIHKGGMRVPPFIVA